MRLRGIRQLVALVDLRSSIHFFFTAAKVSRAIDFEIGALGGVVEQRRAA